MKYKLINNYDVSKILEAHKKLTGFSKVDKNYEAESGIINGDVFKYILEDIVNDAKIFCGKSNLTQSTFAKAKPEYVGTTHVDFDKFNLQGTENKIQNRLEFKYGVFRFILFVQAKNVKIEVDGDIIDVFDGDLYWIDHYLPHNIYNYSNVDRYQIMMDLE